MIIYNLVTQQIKVHPQQLTTPRMTEAIAIVLNDNEKHSVMHIVEKGEM